MSLINIKDLGVTLGAPLFSDLTMTIHPGDRIGLVAANGRGKTTLLRSLAGQQDPTSGEITRGRGVVVAYVEQDVPGALLPLSLRAAVSEGLTEEERQFEGWRVDVVLDDLQVPVDLHDRPLAALSGGWRRTALLAKAWVGEPDLLLLDEPTNHLDLDRIGKLQGWLAALPRQVAVLAASHDRAFLDEATGRTLFLRAKDSAIFSLPYSKARAALDEVDAAMGRRHQNALKKADQLRRQAAKLNNIGINSGSDLLTIKTKQLRERAAKIEEAAKPAHLDQSAGAIRLGNSGTHAKALIALEDLEVTTPDGRLLFKTGKKWIERGDRIVVLGRNGAGKSRLVAAIHGAILASGAAAIRVAPTLALGYCDQALSQLDPDATPFDLVSQMGRNDQATRSALAGAGIATDLQSRPVSVLSGGQKARLAMVVLRLADPNFYLLDEPTNHLDIEGQEALEAELCAYGASGLLVSHDRAFLRATGNRFWLIDGKKLVEVDDPEGFFASMLGAG
ncbi:MAG: ABC-F family ATP-binding cassette domain-containing protein [Albidovulum sp.]